MRERLRSTQLDPRFVLGAATLGFVVWRTWLATQSGFNFHHGWNEGHYALIARGFLDHPLVPMYGGSYVYSVPPLFPYLLSAFFFLLGESALVARFTTILAAAGTVGATYALGRVVFQRERTAVLGCIGLLALPYFQLYAGRVQTDVTMTFLFTASMAAILRGYEQSSDRWLAAGGVAFAAGFAAKQPTVLLVPILLLWAFGRGDALRTIVRNGAVVGLAAFITTLPLLAWFWYNYTVAPTAFVTTWEHELLGRTEAFANVPLVVAVAGILGFTPPVLGLVLAPLLDTVRRKGVHPRRIVASLGTSSVLWSWLIVYGAFVLYRSPRSHQYYAVALAPAVALLAARGLELARSQIRREDVRIVLSGLLVVGLLSGSLVLFELSGEYSIAEGEGDTLAPDVAGYLSEHAPENSTVLVMNEYCPPVKWYLRDHIAASSVVCYHVSNLSQDRLETTVSNSNGPVYVVFPSPTWSEYPRTQATVAYQTETYDYSAVSVVDRYVESDSKLSYYLEGRQLIVYRVEG